MQNMWSDGEYCMSVAGTTSVGARIYCHEMASCSPREYLTLPAGPDENYSHTYRYQDPETDGLLKYMKLRISVNNSTFHPNDWTFTDSSGVNHAENPNGNYYFPMFGKASSCGMNTKGYLSVDLTGTGFYLPTSLQWVGFGYNPGIDNPVRTHQTFWSECTAWCGGCVPQELDEDGNYDGWTYFLEDLAARVMPVAYDYTLDPDMCDL